MRVKHLDNLIRYVEIENGHRTIAGVLSLTVLKQWAQLAKLVVRDAIKARVVWWCLQCCDHWTLELEINVNIYIIQIHS